MTLKRGYTPVLRIIQRWRKTPYWRRARRPAAERGSVLARLCRYRHNDAERDLRMAKVKQKVSGCFRTRKYAEAYCRISSYLQSMANQGYNPLVAIQIALAGRAVDNMGE